MSKQNKHVQKYRHIKKINSVNGFKAYRSHQQIISNKKKQINNNLLEVPEVLVGQQGVVARSEHTVQGGLLLPHVHHSVLVQVTAKNN